MLEPIVQLLRILSLVLIGAGGLLALLLLIRMVLQWAEANPFGWFALNVRRATEPLLRPLRSGFDNRSFRFDMLPIVAAVMVLLTAFFAASIVERFVGILEQMATIPATPGRALSWVVSVLAVTYLLALFLRLLLPYLGIGYSQPFYRFLFAVTEPLLRPLRRFCVVAFIDFSPLVAILLVQAAEWLLNGVLVRF